MLYAIILTCEALFWICLVGGLSARYVWRRTRTGAALLIAAPLVDLITLGAAVLDLRQGGDPSFAHVLVALLIGSSVGFGHAAVGWLDVRFAHRFDGAPAPMPTPRWGRAHAARERLLARRHVVTWAVSAGLLVLAAWIAGGQGADYFLGVARILTFVLAVDLVWSMSYTVRPRPEPHAAG